MARLNLLKCWQKHVHKRKRTRTLTGTCPSAHARKHIFSTRLTANYNLVLEILVKFNFFNSHAFTVLFKEPSALCIYSNLGGGKIRRRNFAQTFGMGLTGFAVENGSWNDVASARKGGLLYRSPVNSPALCLTPGVKQAFILSQY